MKSHFVQLNLRRFVCRVAALGVVFVSGMSSAAPMMSPSPAALSFTGQVHSSMAGSLLTISNSGDATLSYSLSSEAFWLSVQNTAGSLAAGAKTSHVVNVATRGLASLRTYTGTLTITDPSAGNSPQSVPVSLLLTNPAAPSLVVGWGSGDYGQLSTPVELTNALAIAVGVDHSLALKPDGTVATWGADYLGQMNVPPGLTNVVALEAGGYHSLALIGDGTVVCWGYNDFGQVNVPSGLTNVVAVEGGENYSLALTADGTVVAWGNNDYGQMDVPADLSNVVAVAAGGAHSLALKSDGRVAAWGYNENGQTNVPAGLSNVVAVGSGQLHSLALKSDGTVEVWGNGDLGQLNMPVALSNVVAVSCGAYHSLALKADGTVEGWGYNDYGQLSIPGDLRNVARVVGGGFYSLALASADLLTIASELGTPSPGTGTMWVYRSSMRELSVQAMIANGGTQYVNTGWTGTGSVSSSGTSNSVTVTISNDTAITWTWMTNFSLTLRTNGVGGMLTSGTNGFYPAGTNVLVTATNSPGESFIEWVGDTNECIIDGMSLIVPMTQARSIKARFTGAAMIELSPVALAFTGQVFSAVAGQLLTVSNSGYVAMNYSISSDMFWLSVPNPTGSLAAGAVTSHVVNVDTRGLHALRPYTGMLTVHAPGAENTPQTVSVSLMVTNPAWPGVVVGWGNSTNVGTNVPVGLVDVIEVSGGFLHTLALKSNGRVVAWGANSVGQTNVPASLSNVVAVSAGFYHSLALRANGTIVGWGANGQGQATAPGWLTDAVAISAGYYHSMALTTNGTVVTWGWDGYGQVTLPPGLTNAVAISAGLFHSIAVKPDGTVVAWGDNIYGQASVPAGLSNVVAVAGGFYSSMALKSDGTVVAWGLNDGGQTNVPIGLTNAVAISCAGNHLLALKADGKVAAWGWNDQGQTNVPVGLSNVMGVAAGGSHSLGIVPAKRLQVMAAYGASTPGTGDTWLSSGTLQAMMAPSVVTNGGTQYVNTGWIGTGSVPTLGTSNSVTASISNDSSITWLWQTSVWLQVTIEGQGAVDTGSAWVQFGSNRSLTVTASNYWYFASWTGDVPVQAMTSNPVTLLMDSTRSVQARILPSLTSNQIPVYWLAGHGWTNNFEAASVSDADLDGMVTWKEYIAGMSPVNSGEVFAVLSMTATNGPRFQIPTVTGRLYSLERVSSVLTSAWSRVSGQTNIPGTGSTLMLTDSNAPSNRQYYRIRVKLP